MPATTVFIRVGVINNELSCVVIRRPSAKVVHTANLNAGGVAERHEVTSHDSQGGLKAGSHRIIAATKLTCW